MRLRHACLLSPLFVVAALASDRPARACGGCFHEPPPPNTPPEQESVITDHRMVFSISTTQTVLWDQVRYTGNPIEFAWVLPVRPGARVELSHDEWITALDSSTRVTVTGPTPPTNCYGGGGGGFDEGSGGGFGCGSSTTSADFAGASAEDPSARADAGVDAVQVVSQEVVGPYQAVVLRSSDGQAIDSWLTTNGYAIPDAILPVLKDYVAGGFDFIALKLRPGESVRAMQPVRVITPGADATLPLRMVAAGVGAYVGLTLFVVSEGRYHTQNFPDAVLDFTTLLKWDPQAKRSNYSALAEAAMAEGSGDRWLTEAAQPAALYPGAGATSSTGAPAIGLYDAYTQACSGKAPVRVPCDGGDAGLYGVGDGGTGATADGGGAASDGGDAGATPPPSGDGCYRYVDACQTYDDLDVALTGMHHADVWVTRLRSFLPAAALGKDLRLEAAPAQTAVDPAHKTELFSIEGWDACTQTVKSAATTPASNGSSSSSSSDSSSGCACTTAREEPALPSWVLLGGSFAALGFVGARRRAARTRRPR